MAAMATARRAVGKLSVDSSAMLLCDIQDKFVPLIYNSATVVQTSKLLTSVAKELDIPLVVTEQYPKVFGRTAPGCFAEPSHLADVPKFEKKLFSMLTPEVSEHIQSLNRTSFILFGIEAHVCLQQTALDLLEAGKEVHVVVDACSSMKLLDREVALQRMANAGAFLTTAQSAIFMLMKSADHPSFKAVSNLIKEHAKLPNEFNERLMK